MLYEHPSGGKLFQSGFMAVPDDPADLGVSLIVAASKKYERKKKHENVIHIPFKDEQDMPGWEWTQIEKMVVPAVQKMVETLEAGEGVLSVCRAGINRSSLLSGLAIKVVSDLTPQEVVALIRERRSWDCLHNKDFKNVVLYGF